MSKEIDEIITTIKGIPEDRKCVILSVYEDDKSDENSITLIEDVAYDASLEDVMFMVGKTLRDLAIDNKYSEKDMEKLAEWFEASFLSGYADK